MHNVPQTQAPTKDVVTVDTDYFTSIGCRFKQGSGLSSEYTYKCDVPIQVGDTVVVDTPAQGYTTALVTRVDAQPYFPHPARIRYKWIVQRVDVKRYKALMQSS